MTEPNWWKPAVTLPISNFGTAHEQPAVIQRAAEVYTQFMCNGVQAVAIFNKVAQTSTLRTSQTQCAPLCVQLGGTLNFCRVPRALAARERTPNATRAVMAAHCESVLRDATLRNPGPQVVKVSYLFKDDFLDSKQLLQGSQRRHALFWRVGLTHKLRIRS